ncbi:MAG: hypothetical protein WED83_00235 [Acidimicrobiia bacterium]
MKRLLARVALGFGAILIAGVVAIGWLTGDVGRVLVWSPTMAGFIVVGGVVAAHRPENPIGWLYLSLGSAIALVVGVQSYTSYSLESGHPAADWAAWAGTWATWPLSTLLIVPLVLYPNGRLLSPRWRWLLWLAVGFPLTAALMRMLADISRPEDLFPGADHPLPLLPIALADPLYDLATIGWLLVLAASAFSLLVRFRRARDIERQQLKWLMVGMTSLAVAFPIFAFTTNQPQVAFALFGPAIPVTTGLAILRYRLYDIDRIVSRTVSYTVVLGFLAAVYVGGVTWLTSLLPDRSQLVVAATTLAVAAMFNPVRHRIQGLVDRRFNRSRYDAQRVMDRFAGSLRDQVDTEEVVHGWVGVVSETMQPASVAVWVREGR